MADLAENGVGLEQAIQEGKKKAKPRLLKKSKPTQAQIFFAISEVISGFDLSSPNFGVKYHVVLSQDGSRLLLREEEGEVVRYVSVVDGASSVLNYVKMYLQHDKSFVLTPDQAKAAFQTWMWTTQPLEKEPLAVREKSEKGLCFERLQFDFDESAELTDIPVFREFLSRTSNADALAAFIGSIFEEKADRQQYLYLYGQGRNGKGSILRLLAKVLGRAYAAEDPGHSKSQFWTSSFIGKRLIGFADSNHSGFLKSGLLKTLTGGDYIRVEKKGEQAFSVALQCKFIFLSNRLPDILPQESNLRRIIYCELSDILEGENPKYEENLWAEAPLIIGYCRKKYRELCPTYGEIPAERSRAEDISEDYNERFAAIFEDHFKICDSGNGLTGSQLLTTLKTAGIFDNRSVREFKEYIQKEYGIFVSRPRNGISKQRFYDGLAIKSMRTLHIV